MAKPIRLEDIPVGVHAWKYPWAEWRRQLATCPALEVTDDLNGIKASAFGTNAQTAARHGIQLIVRGQRAFLVLK